MTSRGLKCHSKKNSFSVISKAINHSDFILDQTPCAKALQQAIDKTPGFEKEL
jgi:hypothetical protein